MGLDMYLEKIHRDVVGYMDVDIEELDKTSELYKKLRPYIKEQGETYKWISLFEEVGYWRKANAIHNWFVNNIQNGKDDCGRYEVSKEKLESLLKICEKILENAIMIRGKIVNGQTLVNGKWEDILEDGLVVINPRICKDLLPTTEGFFFGSTNYDQFYIEDIKSTVLILSEVLKDTDFNEYKIYYSSSW